MEQTHPLNRDPLHVLNPLHHLTHHTSRLPNRVYVSPLTHRPKPSGESLHHPVRHSIGDQSSEGTGTYRKKFKNVKHSGNISLDDVIEIAKVMRPRSMAKELKGTVKEILGTCVLVGCMVDGRDPKDLQQEIADGDIEIPHE